jgi:putative membrane protein
MAFMKTLLLIGLLAIPAVALTASKDPDTKFYTTLAQGGLNEVDLGKLAQQKASDPKVRDFGAMMVKDHSAANEQLKSLAASKNIKLPDHVSSTQEAGNVKLDVLTGSAFDKAYVQNQITAHQDTVKLLNKEIASGRDPDAKAFAQKVLPTVNSHLQAIDQIAARQGIAP